MLPRLVLWIKKIPHLCYLWWLTTTFLSHFGSSRLFDILPFDGVHFYIYIYIYMFFNGVPGVNSNGYIYIYDSDDIISFHIMQKSDIEINWNNYWLSMVLLSMSFWLLSNSAFDPPWCPKTSRAGRAEWKGQCHRSLRRDGGKGGQLFCFEAAEVTLWEITSFNR